jgi:hypothetical protein
VDLSILPEPVEPPLLPQDIADSLLTGATFVPILRRLAELKIEKDGTNIPLTELDEITQDSSPAQKLANWNVISKMFAYFDISIDSDTKALIVAGDAEVVGELLVEAFDTY